MITDHDHIDLSHQNVPRDENYPLKAQMPTMLPLKDKWELRADIEAETKRAKLIRQADALVEMQRLGQMFDADGVAQALRDD